MIYAIDFGTTNSLLGAAENSKTLHMPIPLDLNAVDSTILRSVMFFPERKPAFFGSDAIHEYVKHGMQGRLIRSIKKFLPMRSFSSTSIGGKQIQLENIIGIFLTEMRARANQHFNRDVDRVVLGRPARFSSDPEEDKLAENRLEKAAKIAGFKEIYFCPEPLAAAYDFKETLNETKTVLVVDFGGGTSDFTVIRIGPETFKDSDVLSLGGISIAGDALDGSLMRKRISKHFGADVQYKVPFGSNILTMPAHLIEKICSPADISILQERDTIEFFKNVKTWSLGNKDRNKMDQLFTLINDHIGFDLFEKIETTKKALSKTSNNIFEFENSGIKIQENIQKNEFQNYSADLVESILEKIDDTIKAAQLSNKDIDLICSTGGTAKVSAIHDGLVARFGKEKIQEQSQFHSVVRGLVRKASEYI